MPHFEYKPAKFHFTEPQIHKIRNGHSVRVAHHQVGKGPHTLFLHPHMHHKLSLNHAKGQGMDLMVGPDELEHTIDSGIQGTGIWDTLKSGFNKYVKPVISGVADAVAYSNPELAPLREGIRGFTGVGLRHRKKHHHEEHEHHHHEENEHHHKEHEHHHKKHHKHARVSKRGNGLYL